MGPRRLSIVKKSEWKTVYKTSNPKVVWVVEGDCKYYVCKPTCKVCGMRFEDCVGTNTLKEAEDWLEGARCWDCTCKEGFEKALKEKTEGRSPSDYYVRSFLTNQFRFEETEKQWWEFLSDPLGWEQFVEYIAETCGDEESWCECPL
jgi:hypothetical protein